MGVFKEMRAHAEATYPEECCGVLLSDAEGCLHVRRCRNIQNELHAEDPEKYSRDARMAYYIDPQELFDVMREADRIGGALAGIYHSHPDHPAYFSAEDRTRAVIEEWDEPIYPEAVFLVLSVIHGAFNSIRAYVWDETVRDYAETPLTIGEETDGKPN